MSEVIWRAVRRWFAALAAAVLLACFQTACEPQPAAARQRDAAEADQAWQAVYGSLTETEILEKGVVYEP